MELNQEKDLRYSCKKPRHTRGESLRNTVNMYLNKTPKLMASQRINKLKQIGNDISIGGDISSNNNSGNKYLESNKLFPLLPVKEECEKGEIEKIDKHAQRRRLSMKPGLTCLWQITGRNGIRNFDDWVALDLEYIDNWSLWLDAKILALTLPAVLRGVGAS
jgi:hypothetical protein